MTTSLTNVVSVPSLTNGPISKSASLLTLGQTDVSSTTIYADVIQIQWQSTDQQIIALLSQKSATTSASATSASAVSRTTSGAAAATSSSTANDDTASGLSSGAKAGIGIGVVLAVALIASAIFAIFFLRRRKSRQKRQYDPSPDKNNLYGPGYHELMQHEASAQTPVEMPSRSAAQELPGGDLTVELESERPNSMAKKFRRESEDRPHEKE